jgi:hypothetical protein
MMDEKVQQAKPEYLEPLPNFLLRDKNIILIKIKETIQKKSYLRNLLVFVKNELVTTNYADTCLFMEELKLFNLGNEQNKYFNLKEKNSVKNLKLELLDKTHIYISKSEAAAIYKMYNESKLGLSMVYIMDYEYEFTPEMLADFLFQYKLLDK